MADPNTFTDGEGVEWELRVRNDYFRIERDATPDDLARAGYVADDVIAGTKIIRELEALRALERYFRATKHYVQHGGAFPAGDMSALLKAIDEARK